MPLTERFRSLHRSDLFIMPNAWDVGSARVLEQLGFPAIATTSSGFAASIGRSDQQVKRDELMTHVQQLVDAVSIPVSVDAECCYPNDDGGIEETVRLLAATGASGFSIEDYVPGVGLLPVSEAANRVREAVIAASAHGLVVTARAENKLYDVDDLSDTLDRLAAYREAGADVLYAPGVKDLDEIRQIVSIGLPVNVLALPGVPTVGELADVGVRRVSTGGSLTHLAYGALTDVAEQFRDSGDATLLARR